jgi:hypothetical protein
MRQQPGKLVKGVRLILAAVGVCGGVLVLVGKKKLRV